MSDKGKRPRWLGEDRRTWDHVRVHVQLIDDPRVGAHEMAVYLGLVKHSELESGRTFVGLDTLAGYTGLSWRSVHRAVQKLAAAEWIEIEARPGRTSIYRLPPPPVTLSQGSGRVAPAPVSGPVLTEVQDTPVQNADEQDPLDKIQGTRGKPLASSTPGGGSVFPSLEATEAAISAACGQDPGELTDSSRAELRRAAKELLAVGADVDSIHARAAEYRRVWPKAKLSPRALAKHWPVLASKQPADVDGYEAPRVREVV